MVAQGSVQPSENRRGIRAALVLTGGGFPGALFEIGALVALDEMMGEECSSTDFDLYVGSSAGSVVGLLLALGVPPEELRKMVLGQSPSLPHLRRQDLFRVQSLPRRLGLSFRHVLRVLRHFSRSGMGIRLSSFLVALLEGLPSGLLSLVPLRSTLEQIIIDLGIGNEEATAFGC
ncbi:MAG: patatin-like phospholipase family protein, partial [Acidobacteriota bacterium]